VFLGKVPNPFGSVANDDLLLGTAPAAFPGFDVESLAELLSVLDGADIGCRIWVANGIAFFVPLGLREYAAKLGLARVRRQTIELAFAARGLLLHYGHAGAVHLDIENGNGLAHDDRQIELHGAIDLLLLLQCNVCADRFGHALHRLGGDLQAGQQFHLLTSVIEGGLLSHQRLHAPHTRRELGVDDVEFLVGGKLPFMAVRA
jgi:hypothetical protein